MKNKLTYKQLLCLEAIEIFKKNNGYSPTIRELCEMLETRYPNNVFSLLKALEQKGYIKTKNGEARTITILRGTDEIIN